MKFIKTTLFLFIVGLAATLTACIDESDAGGSADGITEAQVKQLIADAVEPLEMQLADQAILIASLETNLQKTLGDTVSAGAAGSNKPDQQKVASSVNLGTYLGSIPGQVLEMSSANGYFYRISNATTAQQTAVVQHADRIYYAQAACQGTPYLNFNDPGTPYGAGVDGFVFRDERLTATADDPSTYWMITPGTAPVTVDIFSILSIGQNCSDTPRPNMLLLPAVQNVETSQTGPASAVPSSGVTGPVLVGQ